VSRADELRAELELIELEDRFVAAKESGDVTREQRLELRAARQAFRERREGSAVASPETIRATATANESGV
jgi:hypothetical protein